MKHLGPIATAFLIAVLLFIIITMDSCNPKVRTHKIQDHRKHGRHYL